MQHRRDQQTSLLLQCLLQSGTEKLADQAIPLGLLDAALKRGGSKKRVVGGSRIETGSKAAVRTVRLRVRVLKNALTKEPTFK